MAVTQMQSHTVNEDTQEILRAENPMIVSVIKTSSGQVAIGMGSNLEPPASGRGCVMPMDQQVTFYLFKGDILYACADSAGQQISVINHPPLPQEVGAGGFAGGGLLPGRICR